MKKTAIFLAFMMLIAFLPAIGVTAAESYYLKGLQEGEHILANVEKSRTLTLVNSADQNKLPGNATGVDKVVFTYNDEEAVTVAQAPFEYELVFSSCGDQTLTYEVYTTGSDTPISETINFLTVAGEKNQQISKDENFDTLTDATQFYYRISGSGATASIVGKQFVFTRTASSGAKQFSFNSTATTAGDTKVQQYDFEFSKSAGDFSCILRSGWASGSEDVIFSTEARTDNLASNTTYTMSIILDFNSMLATVRCNGEELKKVKLSAFEAAEGATAVLHIITTTQQSITFDNYKFFVYDEMEPQEFSEASIPGGDDNPVVKDLAQIRITGNGFYEAQNLLGKVSIEPSVAMNPPYIEGNELVVSFAENLTLGTSYTLTVDGVVDENLLAYVPYSLSFRTLNEGENLPPVVQVTSPAAGERYYPGDSIMLTAEASDRDGSVSYVEFYKKGQLIEGSRVTAGENGVYTYEWVTGAADDSLEPVAITALVCDDGDSKVMSSKVNIRIQSQSYPTVSITGPVSNKVFVSNFGGVQTDIKPTLTFDVADLDGLVESIEIYVDGDKVHEAADITEYTLEAALGVGNHTLRVVATDDDDQSTYDEISLIVEDRGKSGYILYDEMTKENLLAKWVASGDATVKNGNLSGFDNINGIIIATDNPDVSSDSSIVRTCAYTLENKSFALDVKLAFSDTVSMRKVMLDTKEILTFTADGKVTNGTTEYATYRSGEIYNVSVVVDTENLMMYVLLDGTLITSTPIANTDFTDRETLSVIHSGAVGTLSETAVVSASISEMAVAAQAPVIKLFGSNGSELDATQAIDGNQLRYITVAFNGGTDEDSLVNNLKLIDNQTGQSVSLGYADGKFNLKGYLTYNGSYSVIVLPDARNAEGKGYSGAYELLFTTGEPVDDVGVDAVTVSGESLDAGVFEATLTIDFNGVGEAGKTLTIVCAAFNGSKMIGYEPLEVAVGTALADATMNVSFNGVTEDTVIEVFVVDDMGNLNAVNDKILRIK